MAQPASPIEYEIEYPDGKIYRMEADAGVSQEQALEAFQQLAPEEQAQFEYSLPAQQEAPATPKQPKQRTASVSMEVPAEGPVDVPKADEPPSVFDFASQERTRATQAWEQDMGARELVDNLVRADASYQEVNKALQDQFGYSLRDSYTPEEYAEFKDYLRTPEGRLSYQNQFAAGNAYVPTGLEDPEAPDTLVEEFGTSARRGLQEMKNTTVAAEAAIYDLFGNEEAALKKLDEYTENALAIEFNNPTSSGTITDIDSFGDAGRWAANTLGSLMPDLATGIGAGTVGKMIAKSAANRAVKQMIEDQMEAGVTREIAEQVAARTVAKIGQRGAVAGTTVQSVGEAIPRIYGDTYMETGEPALGSSTIAGILSGGLDAVLPTKVINKFGGTRAVDYALETAANRYGREALQGFLMEAGTEGLQEVLEGVPSNMITGDWTVDGKTILDVMMRGGFGGSTVSVISRATADNVNRENRPPVVETFDPPDRELDRRTKTYKSQLNNFREQLAGKAAEMTENWTNAPSIEVHNNFSKLKGVDNNGVGIYRKDGTVQINAEGIQALARERRISTESALEAVVFHEALGHYGLDREYRGGLDTILQGFYNNGGVRFRNAVDQWMRQNPDAYKELGEQGRLTRSIEEVVAEISETQGLIPDRLYDRLANFLKNFARENLNLNLKYSTREVRSLLGMAQRNVINGEQTDFDPAANEDKYIYIGESALNQNAFDKLEAAQEAYENDYADRVATTYNPETGILETNQTDLQELRDLYGPQGEAFFNYGAFLGPDREWRTELSDEEAALNISVEQLKTVQPGSELPLNVILEHPELFSAYPGLKDVTLRVIRETGKAGYYDPNNNILGVNPDYIKDDAELKNVILHEAQHWIQEFEGWASGGSMNTVLNYIADEELIRGSKQLLKKFKKDLGELETHSLRVKMMNELPEAKVAREAYADYTQALRDNKSEEERRALYERAKDRLKELKVAAGEPGINDPFPPRWWYEVLTDVQQGSDRTERNIPAAKEVIRRLGIAIKDLDYGNMRRIAAQNRETTKQIYTHLLGEIEARDTEARSSMSDLQRRTTAPYSSQQEIAPYRPIVFKNGRQIQYSEYSPEPDTTSAGFRRREPSRNDIKRMRKEFWENKEFEYERLQKLIAQEKYDSGKYMRLKIKDDGGGAINPEDLSAEELADAQNAYEIIRRSVESYTPTVLSPDELAEEAARRKLSPSAVLRWRETEPGQISKKLFMYDITADKMNTRLTELSAIIDTGDYTEDQKMEYIKTRLAMDELTAKIFGLQSEVGRALRMVQEMTYTRRNLKTIYQALSEVGGLDTGYAGLDDPDTFMRFVRLDQQKIKDSKKQSEDGLNTFWEIAGVPRTIMSSYDLSAPLRQGIVYINRPEYWKSFAKMHYLAGPDGDIHYRDLMKDITNRDTFGYMMVGDLQLANITGAIAGKEEKFQGGRFVKDVPLLGAGVEVSERAYVGFLNKLRADMFDSYMKKMIKQGLIRDPSTLPTTGEGNIDYGALTDEEVKILKGFGDLISTLTGRSKLPGRSAQQASNLLNTIFFSARLAWSRLKTVNPAYYASLPKGARWEGVKQMAFFSGIAGSILYALDSMFDDEELKVEWDPRSSDFLKLQIGDTKYDVLGGISGYITIYTKAVIEAINRTTGRRIPGAMDSLGRPVLYSEDADGFDRSFFKDSVRFIRYKFSPNASFAVDAWEGENAIGEKFELSSEIGKRMVPLFLQDLAENLEGDDPFSQVIIGGVGGFYGVGSNTYTPYPIDPEQEITPPEKFKAAGTPNMTNEYFTVVDEHVYPSYEMREVWGRVVNNYYGMNIDAVIQAGIWEGLDDKTKEEVIDLAKKDARERAKEYMTYRLISAVALDAEREKLLNNEQ